MPVSYSKSINYIESISLNVKEMILGLIRIYAYNA